MSQIIGEFRIGEDMSVALDGDVTGILSATAKMKPATLSAGRYSLNHAATATDLTVVLNGSTGWIISLGYAATALLDAGVYGIDAKLTESGGVEITEVTAYITLSRAAVE